MIILFLHLFTLISIISQEMWSSVFLFPRKMDDILKTVTVKTANIGDLSSSEEEVEIEEKGEKWDCESILSKSFFYF